MIERREFITLSGGAAVSCRRAEAVATGGGMSPRSASHSRSDANSISASCAGLLYQSARSAERNAREICCAAGYPLASAVGVIRRSGPF